MKKKEASSIIIISSILLILGLFASYLYFFAYKHKYVLSKDDVHWGLFGDFIGGVGGTILMLSTIFLLYISIRLQQTEFTKLSNAHLRQGFETSFYNLLEFNKKLFAQSGGYIDINKEEDYLIGEEYFHNLIHYYKSLEESHPNNYCTIIQRDVANKKQKFNHIILSLRHLIKFVLNSKQILNEEKENYFEIIRTQLNANELMFLTYLLKTNVPEMELTNSWFESCNLFKYFKDVVNIDSKKDLFVSAVIEENGS